MISARVEDEEEAIEEEEAAQLRSSEFTDPASIEGDSFLVVGFEFLVGFLGGVGNGARFAFTGWNIVARCMAFSADVDEVGRRGLVV